MITFEQVAHLARDDGDWEPYLVDGEPTGEVKWLCPPAGAGAMLCAGLWRHDPVDHPDGMPYEVAGKETFVVLAGSVELVLEDGATLTLAEGDSASFPTGFKARWCTLKPFLKFFAAA